MQKVFFLVCSICLCFSLSAQKRVSDLTLVYDATVVTQNVEPRLADAFDGATNTVYIKGNLSRSEMQSALASFTTIHDARSGSTVVLQELSGQKILIRMTAADWAEKNKRYQGIVFQPTQETKVIAGYNCVKAIATLQDGMKFTVYYTKELMPDNMDYHVEFKTLGGLPMEYELAQGKMTIRYTLSKLDLNPVSMSKFDIPTKGFREMTYEESRKGGRQ
jgi:GLPGLI family protein